METTIHTGRHESRGHRTSRTSWATKKTWRRCHVPHGLWWECSHGRGHGRIHWGKHTRWRCVARAACEPWRRDHVPAWNGRRGRLIGTLQPVGLNWFNAHRDRSLKNLSGLLPGLIKSHLWLVKEARRSLRPALLVRPASFPLEVWLPIRCLWDLRWPRGLWHSNVRLVSLCFGSMSATLHETHEELCLAVAHLSLITPTCWACHRLPLCYQILKKLRFSAHWSWRHETWWLWSRRKHLRRRSTTRRSFAMVHAERRVWAWRCNRTRRASLGLGGRREAARWRSAGNVLLLELEKNVLKRSFVFCTTRAAHRGSRGNVGGHVGTPE